MIIVFGGLAGAAFKMTWGLLKIFLILILLPVILLLFLFGGLIYMAFPILIVLAVVALIVALVKRV